MKDNKTERSVLKSNFKHGTPLTKGESDEFDQVFKGIDEITMHASQDKQPAEKFIQNRIGSKRKRGSLLED